MTAGSAPTVVCSACGRAIECCALCETIECRELLCYRCVRVAVRQELRQPHVHGG